MRDLPIVFPISLAVILIMMFFTGAYAISAGAVDDRTLYSATAGVERSAADDAWFEKGALFVCPFH